MRQRPDERRFQAGRSLLRRPTRYAADAERHGGSASGTTRAKPNSIIERRVQAVWRRPDAVVAVFGLAFAGSGAYGQVRGGGESTRLRAGLAALRLALCLVLLAPQIQCTPAMSRENFRRGFVLVSGEGLRLFVLASRSPKLNGSVERAQRTDKKELCQTLDSPDCLADLRQKLMAPDLC